jgi:hypothetical protein
LKWRKRVINDGWLGFSHIYKLMRVDEIAERLESYEDIDYSPVL